MIWMTWAPETGSGSAGYLVHQGGDLVGPGPGFVVQSSVDGQIEHGVEGDAGCGECNGDTGHPDDHQPGAEAEPEEPPRPGSVARSPDSTAGDCGHGTSL